MKLKEKASFSLIRGVCVCVHLYEGIKYGLIYFKRS